MQKLQMKKLSGPKPLGIRTATQRAKMPGTSYSYFTKRKRKKTPGRITTSRTFIPGRRRVGKEGSGRITTSRTNIPGIRRVG